jgi:periplasmic protein TonB
MAGPLLYKSPPRWQVWVALLAAVALHGLAAAISAIRPPEPVMDLEDIPEAVVDVAFEQEETAPEPTPPPEEEEPEIEELPPMPTEEPEFVDERPTPTPRPRTTPRTTPVAPIARPKPTGPVGGPVGPVSMASARAKAISAPRPEYPYEARRARMTGSGVVLMTVDTASGAVTSAVMAQSTGSPVLDNAVLSAFRRWRFQPGTVSRVRTPITFTMSGAQF